MTDITVLLHPYVADAVPEADLNRSWDECARTIRRTLDDIGYTVLDVCEADDTEHADYDVIGDLDEWGWDEVCTEIERVLDDARWYVLREPLEQPARARY